MSYNLDFRIRTGQKFPYINIAYIYVKHSTGNGYDDIIITPQKCVSEVEIYSEIDRLIEELKSIRKKFARKFRTAEKLGQSKRSEYLENKGKR